MSARRGAADEPPKRRPGRPRRDDGPAVSRDEIVAAALGDLARNGYAGLSLRALARTLEVSLGAIQYHFATKDDLWRAVADEVATGLGGGPRGQATIPTTPAVMLESRILELVTRAAERPGLSAALWNDDAAGAADRLGYLADRVAPTLDDSRAELRTGIEVGIVRRIDPDILLMLISLGIGSLASAPDALRLLFDVDVTDDDDRRRLALGLADLLLHGVIAGPDRGDVP